MRLRLPLFVGMTLVAACAVATFAHAESGATFSPDRRTLLVNKDVGAERWTVSLNLATPDDPTRVSDVTGNVFKSDGSPPSFVFCQVAESTGSLTEPSSELQLVCKGADACTASARDCARGDWRPIPAGSIPASFFLPDGGLGAGSQALAPTDSVWARVSGGATRAVAWLLGRELVSRAQAGAINRGASLTPDALSYLVNKDVGAERWSISLNLVATPTDDGVRNVLSSVTGNVFKSDGSAPSFVYCTETASSAGNLADLASVFHLRCSGAAACAGTARDCAQSSWQLIADDVPLPASFFLPASEVPPGVTDSGIALESPEGDDALPGIATTEFLTQQATAADAAAGACSVGASCIVAKVGSCPNVPGKLIQTGSGTCQCLVRPIPAECIGCGAGGGGEACGSGCEFPVGSGGKARGQCLPHDASSADCVCYPAGADGEPLVDHCNGPLEGSCSGERCCADDPRDGCDASAGDRLCAGVCVGASSCGGAESCGICTQPTPIVTPTPTQTPTPTPSPTPTNVPPPTPDSSGPCLADCNAALSVCGEDIFFGEYESVEDCTSQCVDTVNDYASDATDPAKCVNAQTQYIDCCTSHPQCGDITDGCDAQFFNASDACGGTFGGCPLIFF